MTILYNGSPLVDKANLLTFIDCFTRDAGIERVYVSEAEIDHVLAACVRDFPHKDGVENASAFKKVANFILTFTDQRPIDDPFPADVIGQDLLGIRNHQNGIVALEFALTAMHHSTIHRSDGSILTIEHPVELSRHSYVDVVEAICTASRSTGFQLLTVLLEQMVYKTNQHCQYDDVRAFSSDT